VDEFVARLEPAALESLSQQLRAPRYEVVRQVEIPGVTDIDMLVWEASTGFALVIQHKWLIGPDSVKESISNDEHLLEGVQQATNSRDYLRDHPEFTRAALQIDRHDQIRHVEAIVVCRGLEGTGFLEKMPNIPILTEKAFVELIAQAADLPTLWNQMVARPDHRRAAERAFDLKSQIDLGRYQFVLLGMAIEVDLPKT
jgi:hypothetical protein